MDMISILTNKHDHEILICLYKIKKESVNILPVLLLVTDHADDSKIDKLCVCISLTDINHEKWPHCDELAACVMCK